MNKSGKTRVPATTPTVDGFRGLAAEGGGMAGIAYLGSLRRWVAAGRKLEQFDHFAGSSAGALTMIFLAVRADLDYMEQKQRSTNFKDFMDDSWGIIGDLWRLGEHYGWYKGDALLHWIEDCLEDITGNRNITFLQAWEKYKTYLVITKVDVLVPYCKLVTMDYKSHPNHPLALAGRESSSIPYIFQAILGNNENINGFEGFELGHIFVDGGTMCNYPIALLYKELKPHEVMGLYLTSPTEEQIEQNDCEFRPAKNHKEVAISIISTLLEQTRLRYIHSDDWVRTCDISVSIKATDFSLSKEKQDEAIKQGWDRMGTFLDEINDLSRT